MSMMPGAYSVGRTGGSRGSRARRAGSRRSPKTEWTMSSVEVQLAPASATLALVMIDNSVINRMTEPTFYGAHVEYFLRWPVVEETASFSDIAWGICVLPGRLFDVTGVGIGPFPLPFSDGEGDWIWNRFISGTSQGADPSTSTDRQRGYDRLRARRRLSEDDVVAVVFEMLTGGPVAPSGVCNITLSMRALLRQ